MKLFLLNKTVLILRNNVEKFFMGLTTNTLEAPRNAFVNIHGRTIATFDQLRIEDDACLIVIERNSYGPLMAHIEKFLKLNQTSVEIKDWAVYFDCDARAPTAAGELTIPQKKGRLLVTANKNHATISTEEFTLFRVENAIPLQGVDYTDEFLLNISDEEFVSYTKGCFLGQEPIAKVHNRSKPTWKLVVRFEDELSDEERTRMTSRVGVPQSGRMKGFIFVRNTPP